MLVIKIILFISITCSVTNITFATGVFASSITSAKSKRGVVHTDYDIHNNQEQSRGTQGTPRILSPENINLRLLSHEESPKPSNIQRISYISPNHESDSYAYGSVPKRPYPYSPPSVHETESRQSNPLTSYFNILHNPSTTGSEKTMDPFKSTISLQKFQGIYSPSSKAFHQDRSMELSDFPESEFPSYSSISKIIARGIGNDASSSSTRIPVYKNGYPLSKVTEYANMYMPGSSLSSDKIAQKSNQNEMTVTDAYGKKISLPIVQLQSNPNFSEIFSSFETQPLLLSTNHPTETDFEFDFGGKSRFNMAPKNTSPFLSPLSSFQSHIVPIQTGSSTPKFPQFKGASIEAYPALKNFPKMQGNYEHLYNQPQLHFGKENGGQLANVRQNTVRPIISTEDILEDVEIINKKNPEPHPSQTDDEDEDDRYKGKDDGLSSEDNNDADDDDDDIEYEPRKYFKEPSTEGDFKPSSSYPFKDYDEKFGKHTTRINDEESENKPHSGHKNYSSSSDDEDDDPSSRYRVESPESSYGSYEEDDEEEEEKDDDEKDRKHEKREKTGKVSHEIKPKQSKYYKKDFEREFDESYKKELPKRTKYAHAKKTSEIDKYDNPKLSKRQPKDANRAYEDRFTESKNQRSSTSRKYRKAPKARYRDSIAYNTNIPTQKTPKTIYEESFGYKNPKSEKYNKRAKTEESIEKYSQSKKLPKNDSYIRTVKYNKPKNFDDRDAFTAKNVNPQSSFANNWKSKENSSGKTASRSNLRQLATRDNRISSYMPSTLNSQARSLTNAEILRDLTGI